MPWGLYIRKEEGLALFWENCWTTIITERNYQKIISLIEAAVQPNEVGISLILMQNGAPCHSSQRTKYELSSGRIMGIVWPSYCSDLDLIQSVSDMMKSHINEYHLEIDIGTHLKIRVILQFWKHGNPLKLNNLISL